MGEAGGGVRTTEVGVEGGGVSSTESWSPGVATHLGDTVVIIMMIIDLEMMSRNMLIMMIMVFILSS